MPAEPQRWMLQPWEWQNSGFWCSLRRGTTGRLGALERKPSVKRPIKFCDQREICVSILSIKDALNQAGLILQYVGICYFCSSDLRVNFWQRVPRSNKSLRSTWHLWKEMLG